MNGISKFLIGLTLVSLIGVASIHLGMLPGNRSAATAKLTAIAPTPLSTDWATISVDGQNLVVTGTAPTPEALAALKENIGSGNLVSGPFSIVNFTGANAPSLPPIIDPHQWVIEKSGTTIILSGNVPSQVARDRVYELAAQQYANMSISGDLDIARSSVDEELWSSAVSIAVSALARLEAGAAIIENDQLTLTGETIDEARAGTIRDLLSAAPATFQIETNLTVSTPPSADLGDVIASLAIDEVSEEAPVASDDTATTAAEDNEPIEDRVSDDVEPSDEPENVEATATQPEPEASQPAPAVPSCLDTTRQLTARASINFETSQTDPDARSRAALDEIAAALTSCPELTIRIVGHTDSLGRAARNQELSGYRADAVAAYLRAKGIAPARLSTRGAGERNPIASNASATGRARNRRIEFQLR